MKRYLLLVFPLLSLALLLSSCSRSAATEDPVPPLPFHNPNILGIESISTRSIETIEDALACLASRQPVYGITLENSNVRPGPEAGTCRVGRVPQGRLVQVNAMYETEGDEPLIAMDGTGNPADLEGSPIGFEDDIKPIADQTCVICHSGVVKTMGLQVTEYDALMAGSDNGPVVVPGNLDESLLWELVSTRQMPMIGELSELNLETIRLWIEAGAPERRSGIPGAESLWLSIHSEAVDEVEEACDGGLDGADDLLVSAELIQPMNCGSPPDPAAVEAIVAALESGENPVAAAGTGTGAGTGVAAAPAQGNAPGVNASSVGIQAPSLGLPAPIDDDVWMEMRGDFCVEQRLPDNERSITAISFAPDGRMFLALDSSPATEVDPLVLYDAFHPSRSIAVYDYINDTGLHEIFNESPRITGLDYFNGALYVTRSGEVGYIPDGGEYEPLAGGFAVQSQLFHANNGIIVHNGYVYISAGGIIDGYSDGPIVGIPESAAQHIASGGNPYSARIVRAPLDRLLSERSIGVFETAAYGIRNPYGITVDPAGQIWFTDNGATNLPDDVLAGDEVDILNPAVITGSDDTSPYYGFPLALNGDTPDWYSDSVVDLVNAASPTGITWAYNTIFFGQYGKDPGLFRLGRNPDGQVVAERLMVIWPLLATATAPDGALWLGTGNGGLFRLTPGCGK